MLVTIAVAGVLIFWVTYSLLHWLERSEVRGAGEAPPPHTHAAVLAAGGTLHDVHVRRPREVPRVIVGLDPETGEPRTASCTTCHGTRTPDPLHGRGKALDAFHTEIVFDHGAGALSCLSCHNPRDYDALVGADGRTIAYPDVMELCSQCHSRQATSYARGAHGGMNGYWDLSRGPRTRHGCTDCHDPHAPGFPAMQPTFKPIDRGLHKSDTSGHE